MNNQHAAYWVKLKWSSFSFDETENLPKKSGWGLFFVEHDRVGRLLPEDLRLNDEVLDDVGDVCDDDDEAKQQKNWFVSWRNSTWIGSKADILQRYLKCLDIHAMRSSLNYNLFLYIKIALDCSIFLLKIDRVREQGYKFQS